MDIKKSKRGIYISILLVIVIVFSLIIIGIVQKTYSIETPDETANLEIIHGEYVHGWKLIWRGITSEREGKMG